MDWNDTPEQAAFRQQVRTLVEERFPAYYRRLSDEGNAANWVEDRKSDHPEQQQAANDWAAAIAERDWFAPHWPKEYGGGGLSSMEQFVLNQELAQAGAPQVGGMGVSLIGPTLVVHGTEDQKREHLPRILSGEVAWAQGYSEPGAGSDLASLQTSAVLDGDEYVVNGQKIWTSGAHHADALFALVRTDPDAPKHRGISFLMIDDIHTPGLTVRPLINMAGEHGFNETFFEDVRVPVRNVLGEVDRGWYVGATLLDFERSNIRGAVDLRRNIEKLITYSRSEQGSEKASITQSLRAEIAERWIETEIGANFSFRIISMQNAGQMPNYEASTAKMFISESAQRLARTATKVFGPYSNLWDTDEERAPAKAMFTRRYVGTLGGTIAGGTSEIQRNIIATRGLGLPRG